LVVGGIEESMIKNQKVAKLKLRDKNMYVVPLGGFSVNGVPVIKRNIAISALLDTGNTLISLPYHQKAPGASCEVNVESNSDFYQLGCKIRKNQIPDLQIELGGVTFEIKGTDLIDQCSSTFGLGLFGLSCLLNIEFQKGGMYSIILGKN